MNDHVKKMIAPVVITLIFLLYLGVYVVLLSAVSAIRPFGALLALPLVLLGAGMLYVLIARIREIRSGEEDDLDNY